ncbi:MAG: VTT domain-containing protein [Patescibacteria group bacterium]
MIDSIVVYIQSIISNYGALGVFGVTIIEEIIAPIPSAIIPLMAGFFLLPSTMSFAEILLRGILIIALPVSIGISIGSTLVYILGFFGGKPAIEKSKKLTGINWQEIIGIEEKVTRGNRDEIALFILRLIPIVPGFAISGFCGVVRYPFQKFIIITFFGSLVRAFILGMIGWQAGELYVNYADIISRFEKIIFFIILFLLFTFLAYRYFIKKSQNK